MYLDYKMPEKLYVKSLHSAFHFEENFHETLCSGIHSPSLSKLSITINEIFSDRYKVNHIRVTNNLLQPVLRKAPWHLS